MSKRKREPVPAVVSVESVNEMSKSPRNHDQSSIVEGSELIDGVIHPHVIVEEIKSFVQLLSGSGSQKRKVVVALFDFHCSFVFQNVALKGYHTVVDRLNLFHSNFEEVLATLPSSPSWKERLFQHLPGETWPMEYLQYLADTKKDWEEMSQSMEKLSKELRGILNDCEPEERYPILCGFRIRDRSERVRTYVNNTILQSWIDVKAKEENRAVRDADFLLLVRKAVYIEYEIELSIENSKRKSDPGEYTIARKAAAEQNFDGKWYPKEWLTFLLVSRPAGKQCTKIFNHPNSNSLKRPVGKWVKSTLSSSIPGEGEGVATDSVSVSKGNEAEESSLYFTAIDDSSIAHRPVTVSLSSIIGQKRPAFHRLLSSDESAAVGVNFKDLKDGGGEDLAAINTIVQSLEKQKALYLEKVHEIDQKLIKYYRLQEAEAELFLTRKMQKTLPPQTTIATATAAASSTSSAATALLPNPNKSTSSSSASSTPLISK